MTVYSRLHSSISPILRSAIASLVFAAAPLHAAPPEPQPKPLRTAVIGGIVMSGLWTELSEAFTEETGIPIQTTIAGNKEVLLPAFRRGEADLIAMHASDEVTTLVAEGWAENLRPWAFNDLVFVGPSDDPAGIRGLTSGAEAIKRIAETKSTFIYPRGSGQGIIMNRLFKQSGVAPSGEWCRFDDTPHNWGVLQRASEQHAYAVTGRIPVAYGKLSAKDIEILAAGDPDMRRPYIVAVANPSMVPSAPQAEAQALADFLLSEKAQDIIRNFAGPPQAEGKGPFFFPLPTSEEK